MLKQVCVFVRNYFQGVEELSSDTVQGLMAEKRDQMILLDTRSSAEYEVSHLEGAIHVDPDTTNIAEVVQSLGLADTKENKDLVCYCTVGYRSSQMAQKLTQYLASDSGQSLQGLLKVYNMEGGLVKWANERKMIVDGKSRPTLLVHPYNAMWGHLLEPQFRAQI